MSKIFRRIRQGEASDHWVDMALMAVMAAALFIAVLVAIRNIRGTKPVPRAASPLTFYEKVPDVPLESVPASRRHEAILMLNSKKCTCTCGMNVAQCRNIDPTCRKSIEIALNVLKDFSSSR